MPTSSPGCDGCGRGDSCSRPGTQWAHQGFVSIKRSPAGRRQPPVNRRWSARPAGCPLLISVITGAVSPRQALLGRPNGWCSCQAAGCTVPRAYPGSVKCWGADDHCGGERGGDHPPGMRHTAGRAGPAGSAAEGRRHRGRSCRWRPLLGTAPPWHSVAAADLANMHGFGTRSWACQRLRWAIRCSAASSVATRGGAHADQHRFGAGSAPKMQVRGLSLYSPSMSETRRSAMRRHRGPGEPLHLAAAPRTVPVIDAPAAGTLSLNPLSARTGPIGPVAATPPIRFVTPRSDVGRRDLGHAAAGRCL